MEKEGLNLNLKNASDVGLTIKRSKLAYLIWTMYCYANYSSKMTKRREPNDVILSAGRCFKVAEPLWSQSHYAKIITSRSAKSTVTHSPQFRVYLGYAHFFTLGLWVRKKRNPRARSETYHNSITTLYFLDFIGIWSKSLQLHWHTNLNLPVMSKNSGFMFPARSLR